MEKRSHPMNTVRRNKKSGHPGYVYHQRGHYYEYIGITHDSDNGKNIALEVNPEPGNTSQAYIKPQPERSPTSNFTEQLHGWTIADIDKPKVESVKKKPFRKNGK